MDAAVDIEQLTRRIDRAAITTLASLLIMPVVAFAALEAATVAPPEPTPPSCAQMASEPIPEPRPYDVPLSDELQAYIRDTCASHGFDHHGIIIALIGAESSYREQAVSATGDHGYMQINEINHAGLREQLGQLDFMDGRDNVRAGVYMMADLYERYGDIGLALMAYNCGERGASDLWEQGIYSTKYSRSIQQAASELTFREEGSTS